MAETRSAKLTVLVAPSVLDRLDAYRQPRRWSRSTAIAVLLEDGLDRAEDSQENV